MPAKNKKTARKINLLFLISAAFLVIFIIFLLSSPKDKAPLLNQKPESGAKNLSGIYMGDLPCADCSGIKETLTLSASDSAQTRGSYLIEDTYTDKNPVPFKTPGTWRIMDSNILELAPSVKNSTPEYFQILNNGDLEMLDSDMKKIDSPFDQTLKKQNGAG